MGNREGGVDMKTVVYTAIFGDIDRLWSPHPLTTDGVEFVCFSDRPRREVGLWDGKQLMKGSGAKRTPGGPFWDVRQVPAKFGPRKTARYYKALSHKWFPDADVTIWLDGNLRLLILPKRAIKNWLRKSMATFNHPIRNCLYDEADFCASVGKGGKKIIRRQTKAYQVAGMPRRWGLPETRCVIRRTNERMRKLNEAWWTQMREFSVRDQISLPFICWKLGIKWDAIPGRAWVNGKGINKDFFFIKHKSVP